MIETVHQVYSPRWDRECQFTVVFNRSCFVVAFEKRKATCSIDDRLTCRWTGFEGDVGNPFMNILHGLKVYAPAVVPEAIEWLLVQYRDRLILDGDAQSAMEELFEWIDQSGRLKPNGEIWTVYLG